jgi:flagellar hook-associated protein 3 FlgL
MLNTQYTLQSAINRQTALQQQIAQLNYDISSEVKVHVASDDPQAAARIAQIGRQQADNSVFTTNVKQAQATSALVDTNLQSVQTAIGQAKEQMLQAANGTLNDGDRQAIITTLQGIQQTLQNLSTQKDSSGNPLYFQSGQPPQIPIGPNSTVAAADSYDDVFGSVTLKDGSTTSLDSVISNAIAALQTTDPAARTTAVNSSLDALDSAATHISNAQSDIGVRETQLNNASDALNDSATNLTTERSGLEDTDPTEAYSEMMNKMTILNAAQSVMVTIGKNSLFDKIT